MLLLPGLASALEPKISPGYTPDRGEDEKGIWTELEEYELAIQRSALLVTDAGLNDYVQDVMCRVAGDYCRDLRVYVIRNPYFNASMTANGVVQVWTGLLLRLSSEDELAVVLGHELAHYTQLHSLERLRQASQSLSAGAILDFGLALLSGVYIPVGQMTAVAGVMAFSRDDEREADLMGADFMAAAGYDPAAAPHVWEIVVEEEERASVKSKHPNIFNKTHPTSADRIADLREYVEANYGSWVKEDRSRDRHLEILDANYFMLMEDQIDTNRFGRTEAMLDRHQAMGIDRRLVDFFRAEMYRQRGEKGDDKLAEKYYLKAAHGDVPVPEACRNLGYVYMKRGDRPRAKYQLQRYLEAKPAADDRQMIEYYLKEL